MISASSTWSRLSAAEVTCCCWCCWCWNSWAMAAFNHSCSWWVALSSVVSAFLASLNSLSTICSPFANLVCNSWRFVYCILASSERESKPTRFSSWLWFMVQVMYWKANTICCLRRSVWFVGVLAWCLGLERAEVFPTQPGKGALDVLLSATDSIEPGSDVTETALEDGLNVEACGVEVFSSSIIWSDSWIISGWGERDLKSWSAIIFVYRTN